MASAIKGQRTVYFNGTSYELVNRESVARELTPPQKQERRQVRPAPRPKVNRAPAILLGSVVAACVLVLVVFGYGKLYQATSEVAELKATLENLEEQRTQLQGEYNNLVDYRAVEEEATERLGMMKPGNGQTIYVNLSGTDRGEVLNGHSQNTAESGMSSLQETFSGLAEYFQ